MKCPKCHYLSFEPEPRCRNCGYDLALADADLAMREFESEDPDAPAANVPLHHEADEPEPVAAVPRSLLRDRSRAGAESSRGTVLDLPTRPRAPRRPRPISPVSTETRTARTAAAAARVAALEAPLTTEATEATEATEVAEYTEHTEDARYTEGAKYPTEYMEATERHERLLTPEPTPESSPFLPEPVRMSAPPVPTESPRLLPPAASSRVPTSELPLFIKGLGDSAQSTDDALMGRAAAAPRAPLGVRRSVADTPAPTPASTPAAASAPARPGAFDRDLMDDLARIERDDARQARADARALVRAAEIRANGDAASPVLRLAAAIVDLSLMSAVSLAIIALTLRLCGLSFAEARVLPLVPLTGFLLLVGAGYLMLFTMAGGQTIGKMTFGLRTVAETGEPDHRDPMTMSQAASRALLTVPSVLALGLGVLPAFFGDRRALHDRLAHTRVVRA